MQEVNTLQKLQVSETRQALIHQGNIYIFDDVDIQQRHLTIWHRSRFF